MVFLRMHLRESEIDGPVAHTIEKLRRDFPRKIVVQKNLVYHHKRNPYNVLSIHRIEDRISQQPALMLR